MNVNAGPNPTPLNKLGKYNEKTKKSKLVGNLVIRRGPKGFTASKGSGHCECKHRQYILSRKHFS